VSASPDIGFETTFDTRTLPNGLASLAAIVHDELRRFVFLRAITGQGMKIIVDNPKPGSPHRGTIQNSACVI
jgi:hypothetical protein